MPSTRQALVIGLGRFGCAVGRRLEHLGHEVLGIDVREREAEAARAELTQTLVLDASDSEQLEQVGVRDFDVVVVAIGDDIEASVLATANARELGAIEVVAKARTSQHARILERVGATRVVFPEDDMGVRVADAIADAGVLDRMPIAPGVVVAELLVPSLPAGTTLEVTGAMEHGLTVVAVRRGDLLDLAPPPALELQPGAIVVLAGPEAAIERLARGLRTTSVGAR